MTQIWCIAVSMQYAQIMGNVPYVMSTVNGMEVIQYTKNDFTHLNSLWSLLDVVVVVVIVPVLWRESECWCVGVAGRGHAGVTQWPEINGAQLFSNVNNTISSPEYEYRFLEKVLKRFLIWEKRERGLGGGWGGGARYMYGAKFGTGGGFGANGDRRGSSYMG